MTTHRDHIFNNLFRPSSPQLPIDTNQSLSRKRKRSISPIRTRLPDKSLSVPTLSSTSNPFFQPKRRKNMPTILPVTFLKSYLYPTCKPLPMKPQSPSLLEKLPTTSPQPVSQCKPITQPSDLNLNPLPISFTSKKRPIIPPHLKLRIKRSKNKPRILPVTFLHSRLHPSVLPIHPIVPTP